VDALHRDVQQHAERPQVGGGVALLAADAFGGDVLGRPDETARRRQPRRVAERGDPEVGEHGRPVRPQQYVRGLHVAVVDADGVRGAQPGEHASADHGGVPRGQRAAGEEVLEGAAGDQLHHEPGVR
jgi:hypothetical protein